MITGLARLAGVVASTALLLAPGVAAAAPGPPLTVPAATLDASLTCSPGIDAATADPVVLVPAFSTDRESYGGNYLTDLPARGIPVCSVSLADRGFADLQTATEHAVHAIRTAAARSGRRVRVLGHQHGAIDLLLALRFWPDLPPLVTDYVSLATPHQGTRFARDACGEGSCAPSVWQIAVGSALIGAMNRDRAPAGPAYTSITTAYDEVITPQPAASQMAGARNITLQDVCPGRPVEHFSILGDVLTRRLVLDAFTHPGPADPGRLQDPCVDPPGEGRGGFSAESLTFVPSFAARNVSEAVPAEPALRCPFAATGCAPPPVPAACVSRRRFTVTVPRGATRVRVTLGGRRLPVRARRAVVDLRGRRATTVTVRITGRTAGGRVLRQTRRFRTCVPGRS